MTKTKLGLWTTTALSFGLAILAVVAAVATPLEAQPAVETSSNEVVTAPQSVETPLPDLNQLHQVASLDLQRPLIDPPVIAARVEPVVPVAPPVQFRLLGTIRDTKEGTYSMAIIAAPVGNAVALRVGETFSDPQSMGEYKVVAVSNETITMNYQGQEIVVHMERKQA